MYEFSHSSVSSIVSCRLFLIGFRSLFSSYRGVSLGDSKSLEVELERFFESLRRENHSDSNSSTHDGRSEGERFRHDVINFLAFSGVIDFKFLCLKKLISSEEIQSRGKCKNSRQSYTKYSN